MVRGRGFVAGGLDRFADWMTGNGAGAWQNDWVAGLGGDTLLEDLVRTASRDPELLEPVRRLIDDLPSTGEGRWMVPAMGAATRISVACSQNGH